MLKIIIPLAKFALAQGLRSAELTALLARVFTETLVSRFYSLLTSDRVLEIVRSSKMVLYSIGLSDSADTAKDHYYYWLLLVLATSN